MHAIASLVAHTTENPSCSSTSLRRTFMRIRIRKMEADRTAFAEEVAHLGAQAGELQAARH